MQIGWPERVSITNLATWFCTCSSSSWRTVLEGFWTVHVYSRTGHTNVLNAISFTTWDRLISFISRIQALFCLQINISDMCVHLRSPVIVMYMYMILPTFSRMVLLCKCSLDPFHLSCIILHLTDVNLTCHFLTQPTYIFISFWSFAISPVPFISWQQTQSSAKRCIPDSIPSEISFIHKMNNKKQKNWTAMLFPKVMPPFRLSSMLF